MVASWQSRSVACASLGREITSRGWGAEQDGFISYLLLHNRVSQISALKPPFYLVTICGLAGGLSEPGWPLQGSVLHLWSVGRSVGSWLIEDGLTDVCVWQLTGGGLIGGSALPRVSHPPTSSLWRAHLLLLSCECSE